MAEEERPKILELATVPIQPAQWYTLRLALGLEEEVLNSSEVDQPHKHPKYTFSGFSVGCCISREKVITLMTTGAFSRNVGKLFSKLKLVTDNLLSIYPKYNRAMFRKWLESTPNVSWNDVIKALDQIGEKKTTKKVRKGFCLSQPGNLYGAANHGDDHHSEKGVEGENEVDHGILDW